MGNKQVRSFDFGGNVRLQSLLTSATQVLRQVNLAASKMTYEAGRGVTVPVPGTLFMFDRRPDRQPSAMPTAGAGVPSGKGTTAISWQEQLQYDMAAHTVTFDRDVRFAHRALAPADGAPADVPEEPFRLDADKLVATLADNGKPGPNGEIAGAMGGAQLKAVHSTGSVVFTGRGVLVHASQIDFDPDAQVIVATGTLQDPVQFDEVKGIATGTATYVRFNLKSGQIEDLKNPTGTLGTKGLKARLGSAGETKAK